MLLDILHYLLYVWPFPIIVFFIFYFFLFNLIFIKPHNGYARAEIFQNIATWIFVAFSISGLIGNPQVNLLDWKFWLFFQSSGGFHYLLELTAMYSIITVLFSIPYYDTFDDQTFYPIVLGILALFCNWIYGQMLMVLVLLSLSFIRFHRAFRVKVW